MLFMHSFGGNLRREGLVEIDQLRYFLRVAELKSFTKAADDLLISQPALSRSIKRLESELGKPVFNRKPRSLELTDAGVFLEARARQVVRLLDDTRAELMDDGESGRLRIGAIPTVAPYLLPEVLQAFAKDFPRATVTVLEAPTDRLLRSCTQGDIDLAVMALPIAQSGLECEELFEEELFLVLPTKHRLARKKRITVSDLEAERFIMLDEEHCLSDSIVSFCRQDATQPLVMERASQLAMVQELVTLGHGVSMIPLMAQKMDKSKRRVYRSLAPPRPTRQICVVWDGARFHSRLHQAFRDRIARWVKQRGKK